VTAPLEEPGEVDPGERPVAGPGRPRVVALGRQMVAVQIVVAQMVAARVVPEVLRAHGPLRLDPGVQVVLGRAAREAPVDRAAAAVAPAAGREVGPADPEAEGRAVGTASRLFP
jgi:hypothetical protein